MSLNWEVVGEEVGERGDVWWSLGVAMPNLLRFEIWRYDDYNLLICEE
jgi:hypothetical protein